MFSPQVPASGFHGRLVNMVNVLVGLTTYQFIKSLNLFVGAGPCACPKNRATTGGCPYKMRGHRLLESTDRW